MQHRPKIVAQFHLLVAVATLLALPAALANAQQRMQSREPLQRAAVATRALARGVVLGAGDFVYRDTTLIGRADSIDAGWVTRRSFAAGEVLRSPAVEPPTIVSANQSVEIEWRDQNVRLTIRGTATRNAALGERIPVRTELGHRIDATVVAPGRVRLD